MANEVTKKANVLVPEVLADMLSARLEAKIQLLRYVGLDNTLQGTAGDTVQYPAWSYSGDAEDVEEGNEVESKTLAYTKVEIKIKKVMKAIDITDEAVLSGYGHPYDEAESQLLKGVLSKMQKDVFDTALKSKNTFDGSAKIIDYDGIVDAIDLFDEEVNTLKVLVINPKQLTQLRKDPNFISADKYGKDMNVMLTGEVGRVCNTIVLTSKVAKETSGKYNNILIKLESDDETEQELAGVTILMKRDIQVEVAREAKKTLTSIVTNCFYGVGLTNESKVVVAKFAKTAPVVTPTQG